MRGGPDGREEDGPRLGYCYGTVTYPTAAWAAVQRFCVQPAVQRGHDRRERRRAGPDGVLLFTGWNGSLFGDLPIQGTEGMPFYTRQKVTLTRWPKVDRAEKGTGTLV